jgi:hypothetical protein
MSVNSTAATGQNVVMWAGDELTLRIPILGVDGLPIQLPGAVGFWYLESGSKVTLSKDSSSGVAIALVDGTYEMTISLISADTADRSGVYEHRARVIDQNGRLETITVGRFTIQPSPGRPS